MTNQQINHELEHPQKLKPEELSQTSFSDSQEQLQAPPGLSNPLDPPNTKPPKNKKLVVIVIFAVITTLLLIVSLLISSRNQNLSQTPKATPDINIQINTTPRDTEFGRRLGQLQNRINNSDPSTIDLTPPPIDFKLEL